MKSWGPLLLSCVVPFQLSSQCPDGSPPPCRGPSRSTAPPLPTSVAVLYFDNLSRDARDDYLAEGLTEEIIVRLGRVDRLRVKARTAVQRLRHLPATDPASLGNALRVAQLVTGSVHHAGTRVRITVELVRANDGAHVWGDLYDRPDTDLLAVEGDIAQAVATAIAGRLLPAERDSLLAGPTDNPHAYELFLQGNHDLALRTGPAAMRAIREYESAWRLDTTFARALARAAFGYSLFPSFPWPYPGISDDSLLALSASTVDRALRVDSASSDAWMVYAYLQALDPRNPFAKIQHAYRRAVTLDPRNDEAWHLYGCDARQYGEDSVSRSAFQQALLLEPQRPITLARLAELDWEQRRFEEARRLLDSAIAVNPDFYVAYWDRALVRLGTGELAAARLDAVTAVRLGSDDPLVPLGLALVDAASGDSGSARKGLAAFWSAGRDSLNPNPWEAVLAAQVYAALGEQSRALALTEHVRELPTILWDFLRFPTFDPIRSTPSFQRLFLSARPPWPR